MPYVLIRHKVEDYAKWKVGFDADADTRKAGGSTGGHVFRDHDDPNMVSILLEMKDMASLQQMMQRMESDEMKKVMQEAGVLGPPEAVYVFGEAEKTDG